MKRALAAAAVLPLLVTVLACQPPVDMTPPDVANGTYTIEQRTVTLRDGVFEEPAAPGSAAKITTRLLDARDVGDLAGKGLRDAAVVLTQTGGGSGTFYYLVAVLNAGSGKGTATPAVLLGDRIGVEGIGIASGKITVRLMVRGPGEPFAAAPSLRATRIFEVKAGALSEVK